MEILTADAIYRRRAVRGRAATGCVAEFGAPPSKLRIRKQMPTESEA